MSVIGPACTLPSTDSSPCGCVPQKAASGNVVAATASASALAAVACTACCVLPFTLPATLLAFAGGTIALLDHAHVWMRYLAIAAVIGAWLWIAWQRRRSGAPIARPIIAWMIAASLLTTATAAWPLFQPTVFKAMGIVKKSQASQDG
jgi:hypothetical protein